MIRWEGMLRILGPECLMTCSILSEWLAALCNVSRVARPRRAR